MTAEIHTMTATVGGVAVAVISGQVALDDTWSPYVQATLDIVAPAVISSIDPRTLARIVITETRTVVPATVPSETRSFNLHIRSRVLHDDGTATLTCTSDEALLQDLKSLFESGKPDLTTVRGLINWLFNTHFKTDIQSVNVFSLLAGSADGALEFSQNDGAVWLAYGQSYWDLLTPFLQSKNLRLWCDEARVWRLTAANATVSGSVTLATGDRITGAEDQIDRDNDTWCDMVLVSYKRSTEFGPSIYPLPGAGPISKVFHVEVDARAPYNQFSYDATIQAPARLIYERLQKRGRTAPIDALSIYTVTPGMAAQIVTPTTASQTATVQAVTWRHPQDEMTVTTRNLTG